MNVLSYDHSGVKVVLLFCCILNQDVNFGMCSEAEMNKH